MHGDEAVVDGIDAAAVPGCINDDAAKTADAEVNVAIVGVNTAAVAVIVEVAVGGIGFGDKEEGKAHIGRAVDVDSAATDAAVAEDPPAVFGGIVE